MNHLTGGISALSAEQRELMELLLEEEGVRLSDVILPFAKDGKNPPLSLVQERLWAAGELVRGTAYGNVPIAFRVVGPFDAAALQTALDRVVARHEVLRTAISADGAAPRQVVHADARIVLDQVDVPGDSADQRWKEALAIVAEHARRPFDPAEAPLARAFVGRLDRDDHILLFTLHHLITDGWGARILLGDVAEAYRAAMSGQEPDWPSLPVQYGDVAAWQREWLHGDTLATQVEFWRNHLAGAPIAPAVGCRRCSAAHATVAPARSARVEIEPAVAAAIRRIGEHAGATPYTVLLAGLQVLFCQRSGDSDVVVGTTISNRSRREFERLAGNFANNLLLRAGVDPELTFKELVERARDVVAEAQACPDLPLELLLHELQRRGEPARIPPFTSMLIVRDGTHAEAFRLPDANVADVPIEPDVSAVNLAVDLVDGTRGIAGSMTYRADAFADDEIAALVRDYVTVLARAAEDPDARVSALVEGLAGGSARNPVPDEPLVRERSRLAGQDGTPNTPVEQFIAGLWASALQVDDVRLDDNFFDLGGHSLLAMSVIHRIAEETGHRFSPLELGTQSLRQLASVCEARATRNTASGPAASKSPFRRWLGRWRKGRGPTQ